MSLSPHEKFQCNKEVSDLDLRLDYVHRAVDVARKRIQTLKKEKLFIEIVVVNAQIIEKHLKFLVAAYASRKRILNLIEEKDIYANVKLDQSDDETLGYLISIIKRSGADPDLVRRLDEFNILRKEAVHSIFEMHEKVEEFDKRVETYFERGENSALYDGITKEQQRIKNEITKIIDLAAENRG